VSRRNLASGKFLWKSLGANSSKPQTVSVLSARIWGTIRGSKGEEALHDAEPPLWGRCKSRAGIPLDATRRPATLIPAPNAPLNRGTKSHSITAPENVNDKIRRPDSAYLVRVSGFLRLPLRTKQPCSVQRLCSIQGSGSAERPS
jgi:hypothetical protein